MIHSCTYVGVFKGYMQVVNKDHTLPLIITLFTQC